MPHAASSPTTARQVWLLGALLCLGVLRATEPTLPLADVQAGMEGTWRTVVAGTEIREYPLVIVGTAPNFIGPGRSVILARALDAENIGSGPVAGMSGSPVYIGGRLVGAYAYGFTWPKDEALIGITPIADMLEADAAGAPTGGAAPAAQPLATGGLSAATLAAFGERWTRLGFSPTEGGVGGGGPVSPEFKPGSAMAAVLLEGDFSAAATGTVTWVEGDRLLGFGHPFTQRGTTDIPLAGAEILTVVRNLRSSFKLSKTGPIVGTLTQDRLTAVAGQIGPRPRLADLELELTHEGHPARRYQARAWPHPDFLPLLAASSLLEGLQQNLGREARETVRLRGEIRFVDPALPPITWDRLRSGEDAALQQALALLGDLDLLGSHPEKPAAIAGIRLAAEVQPRWRLARLAALRPESERLRAGAPLRVRLELETYQGARRSETLDLRPRAELRPGEVLWLVACDAATADRADGLEPAQAPTLARTVGLLGQRRAEGVLYVRLLRPDPGLVQDGSAMPGLPPSVRHQLLNAAGAAPRRDLPDTLIAEATLPLPSDFQGQLRQAIRVE